MDAVHPANEEYSQGPGALFEGSLGLLAGGLLLIVSTLLVYWPALHAGFIWDDDQLITTNPLIIEPGGLKAIWLTNATVDYTPLTTTSFWLEWRLWGAHAPGYHTLNVLLHAASAILIWRIIRQLRIPGGWLAALLFAVHPVNAASVAWVAERKNTLSMLFYLLSIFWYLRYRERQEWCPYGLALAAALAAFLSKGSTVVLPVVLLLCAWWQGRRLTRRNWDEMVPFFALSALMISVTVAYQNKLVTPETAHEPLAFRAIRAGCAVWFYVWKDLVPLNQATLYPKWNLSLAQPLAYLPALLAAAVLALAFTQRQSTWGRAFFFACAYFVVALSPALGLVNMAFLEQVDVADWWQYLAMIAVMAALAAMWSWAWRKAGRAGGHAVNLAGVAFVVFLSLRTWSEAHNYQDLGTFSRKAVADNPQAWAAQDDLAVALRTEGRLREAEMHLRKALQIKPADAVAHSNMGLVLLDEGQPEEAIAEYRESLKIYSRNVNAHINLGYIYQQRHQFDEAAAEYEAALKLNPHNASAHCDLGAALLGQGNLDGAVAEFTAATGLNPAFIEARFNRAATLRKMGRTDEAIAEYKKILTIRPKSEDAHNGLGLSYEQKGMPGEALKEYEEALRINPAHPYAQQNLARLKGNMPTP